MRPNNRTKLRKCLLGVAASLAIPSLPLTPNPKEITNEHLTMSQQQALTAFQTELKSRISEQERDMLAQLVYGEAGHGTDAFEVIHTVLNRMASPLYSNKMADVITQKNQYVGYRAENPVLPQYRRMVDLVVDEWEANDCQCIANCHHFYFITGIAGLCNKFEISADAQGSWVPPEEKQYAKLWHYCPTAVDQAKRFHVQEMLTIF